MAVVFELSNGVDLDAGQGHHGALLHCMQNHVS